MKEKIIKFIKLISLGAIIGVVCGFIGAFFHFVLDIAAEAFAAVDYLLYFLIPAGLLIVLIYKLLKVETKYSTVSVIKAVRNGEEIPKGLSASIFLSTFITHIFGGSSGREGAALQLGGSVASAVSSIKLFNLGANLRRGIVMCGMSAVFSALFGTPLAAAVFVVSIINVRQLYKIAAVPCIVSSYVAFFISKLLGNNGVRYTVSLKSFNIDSLWQICLVALLSAFISIIFCFAIENGKKISALIKNEYLRIIVGGAAVVGLTLLIGVRDYNGAGSAIIEQAISGVAKPEAFALKLLFTCIT
ncbi:MAG: chloride channel protein, partial [Clostridia bacterium]|nr:chloride channel protein [Clostridia bacterium]